MPKWRNWQTRWTRNPVSSKLIRFDPPSSAPDNKEDAVKIEITAFRLYRIIFMSSKITLFKEKWRQLL